MVLWYFDFPALLHPEKPPSTPLRGEEEPTGQWTDAPAHPRSTCAKTEPNQALPRSLCSSARISLSAGLRHAPTLSLWLIFLFMPLSHFRIWRTRSAPSLSYRSVTLVPTEGLTSPLWESHAPSGLRVVPQLSKEHCTPEGSQGLSWTQWHTFPVWRPLCAPCPACPLNTSLKGSSDSSRERESAGDGLSTLVNPH